MNTSNQKLSASKRTAFKFRNVGNSNGLMDTTTTATTTTTGTSTLISIVPTCICPTSLK